MKRLIVIHPKDESTAFLDPIWKDGALEYIAQHQIINVGFSEEEHNAVFEILKNAPKGSNVVYLGHGSSYSLKGACGVRYKKETFFSKENLHFFEHVNLLCLSCKSADFLRPFPQLNYVAFGDLPTQMAEITGLREQEYNAYKGVDEEVIESFRSIIVNTIANSIYEWIMLDLSSRDLYHRIRIRLMRDICTIVSLTAAESEEKKGLLELLVDMRNELEFR